MSKLRILLVDDEVSGTEVLGLILTEGGFKVTMAADGREAMARLDEAAPDLLVTDFMMPVMNGGELVKAIRATVRYHQLPVLLMSGAPEAALQRYGVGHQRFLRKPFALDEFLVAVHALLNRRT